MAQKNRRPLIRKHTPFFKKRPFILTTALVIILALGFGGWKLTSNTSDSSKNTDQKSSHSTKNASSEINYNPPTDEDKKATEEHKDQLAEEQKQPAPTPTPGDTVTPVINRVELFEGNIEVSSYVPGIIEEGGTCTITATRGSGKVTKQVTGLRNATNTSCQTVQIPRSEFPSSGDWVFKVSYSSSKYNGTSSSKTVRVE